MENQITSSDPHEVVRELQDKVRKLELQLSQQTSLNSRNGFVDKKKTSFTYTDDSEISCEDIINVNTFDFSDVTRWFYALNNNAGNSVSCEEVLAWLRQNIDANPNQSFQLLRRKLYTDLYNAELEKRRSIDTRTFTRPKKRIMRTPLEMMPEAFPTPNFRLMTPPESPCGFGAPPTPTPTPPADISELPELDDMTCSLVFSSLIGSLGPDAAPDTDDAAATATATVTAPWTPVAGGATPGAKTGIPTSAAAAMHKAPSQPELREEEKVNSLRYEVASRRLSSSARSHSGSLAALHHSDLTIIDIDATFNKGSDPGLNTTATNNSAPTSRGSSPANSTFVCPGRRGTLTLTSRRGSSHMTSADSDDQLSVASDGSLSSASRMMSVGDVHNLARLQEESLVMSTPKHVNSPKKSLFLSDDKVSPITGLPSARDREREREGGMGSDNSSHSTECLSRSPLSSKHSSRSGSPSGIRPPSEFRSANGPSNLIRRDTFNAMPRNTNVNYNTFTRDSRGGSRDTNGTYIREPCNPNDNVVNAGRISRPSVTSGIIRPPSTAARPRPSALPTLVPRPGTAIPRPASRIPPPRTRTSIPSQPTIRKLDWTDECY